MTDKRCPNCGEWMEQTAGYVKAGVSHGTSWKCPDCERSDIEHIKQIILRGWDEQLFSFEMMAEDDEQWLLHWAGHPLERAS